MSDKKHENQPLEYPAWRYHKVHEPVMLKSDEEFHKLPGKPGEWHDEPKKVGVKMEVFESSGGHQKVRRVKDYVAPEHEEQAAIVDDQGHVAAQPEEDLSKASDDRLREVLVSHGYPVEKVEGKSRKQLLKLLAE